MTKYLYGASIQGIQNFILETDKLKEIIGASLIVDYICKDFFISQFEENEFKECNLVIGNAGNIKYIFENKIECETFVKSFIRKVHTIAPSMTINQAVEKFEEDKDLASKINILEDQLRIQRNRVNIPIEIGYMGIERSRRSGNLAIKSENQELLCKSISEKLEYSDKNDTLLQKLTGIELNKLKDYNFPIKTDEIATIDSYIAIIHADGNGIGNIVQELGGDLVSINKFQEFSAAIELSTLSAVKAAYKSIFSAHKEKEIRKIRPIIMGGDDLTIIIDAKHALDFTKTLLTEFETQSAANFKGIEILGKYKQGLTMCAGISFIKSHYPLSAGIQLAEELCQDAKRHVKAVGIEKKYAEIPKSSIAFYKEMDSFGENLTAIKSRALTTPWGLSYYGGPYTLKDLDNFYTKLDTLIELSKTEEKSSGKIRSIVEESYESTSTKAKLSLQRYLQVTKNKNLKEIIKNEIALYEISKKSHLNDLVNIYRLKNGEND